MPRRSGLGRGLDALLPAGREATHAESGSALREVTIDLIDPNPNQPRHEFEQETMDELAASISELGILQPLLARAKESGRLELVAGERRLRAARAAGLETVPVLVVETDERGSLERALVENIHREDLNPLEEAAAYNQLMDEGGLTQDALGARLGRSQSSISNTMRLLELPVSVQRLLTNRQLTEGHARALLGLQGHPMQDRAARSVVTEGLSVRATEDLVRRYLDRFGSEGAGSGRGRPRLSATALETQRRLADRLQARVKIETGKRKQRIVIEAVDDEEMERITAVILGGPIRLADGLAADQSDSL